MVHVCQLRHSVVLSCHDVDRTAIPVVAVGSKDVVCDPIAINVAGIGYISRGFIGNEALVR